MLRTVADSMYHNRESLAEYQKSSDVALGIVSTDKIAVAA